MRKSAHYRRAVWLEVAGKSLSNILSHCLGDVANGVAGSFELSSGFKCLVARRVVNSNTTFVHFVTYEEESQAAVISALEDLQELDAAQVGPPPNTEFLHGQLYLLLRGNDCLWTTHNSNMREGSIQSLVRDFVREYSNDEEDLKFVFSALLDHSQLESAFDQGIEAIELGLGGFRSTVEEAYALNRDGDGPLSYLASLWRADPTAEQQEAAADVQTRVILRPGRKWKKENVKEFLADVAMDVYEDEPDEGFVIVTKTGVRLTRDKLTLSRRISVEGNNRILTTSQVVGRLTETMEQLVEAGIVE